MNRRTPARYLEHRIVYCADCETRRSLANNSGVLACSVCGSEHWMHLSPVNLPPAKSYDEGAIQAQATVDRTVERLTKEVFLFARRVAGLAFVAAEVRRPELVSSSRRPHALARSKSQPARPEG